MMKQIIIIFTLPIYRSETLTSKRTQQPVIRYKSKYILYIKFVLYSNSALHRVPASIITIIIEQIETICSLERGVRSIFHLKECPAVCLPHYFVTA